MKRALAFSLCFSMALFGITPSVRAHVANLLGNSSFENSLGGSANWNNTANRGIDNPIVAGAPDGVRVLRLSEAGIGGAEDFTFTFQTVEGARPGDTVAFSGFAREVTTDGDDDGQIRIEFQKDDGTLISDVVTSVTTAAFGRVVASGTAPDGTLQVTFTLRIQNASDLAGEPISSVVDFDNMQASINGFPVLINATATGEVQNPGDLTMISTRLENTSADALNGVQLVATPSGGLTIHPEQALLDGRRVNQREGSVIFEIGNLSSGQDSLFAFAVMLSSGIVPGKRYEITLFARNAAGIPLSDITRIIIDVEPDPLFHMGTIIGKVFNDLNGNEMQDSGEAGVPNVRIATEQGIVVYTDAHGKYHIPAVMPGRHVVKVDWHSLPEGTQFVTEESYLTKITEGLLAKVNFAVKLPESEIPEEYRGNLHVQVIQELDRIKPELSLAMDPPILKAGKGLLEQEAVFRLHTNYGNLINEWRVEVRDEMGEEVWTGIGRGGPPPEVRWDGKDNSGNLIEAGDYALRLIVMDKQEREDWTPLQFFRVQSKLEIWKNASAAQPYLSVGYFDLMKDGKRSIPLAGRTAVRIQGKTPSKNTVLVNRQPVGVGENGGFEAAMFLPDGKQKVEVTTTTEAGESLSFQKEVEIKDNYFFMVGLGEEELGNNKFRGNIESVGTEDRFRDGFYEDGRVAYYLKGKLKGKFLVTSAYDSEDDQRRSKLFTNLDPDQYYPVYGDASVIDTSANETQDKFFILVEKDKSFLKWGSFNTDFSDTELATHSRTGSGGKVHFETLASTRFGDPKTRVQAFHTEQKQLPDRNEFNGTGGSLYYLRKRLVVEGSEKVRVEVRDKVTGVILSRRDLASGADYEIDYDQGRIILKKPLLSVAASDTVINQSILDGHNNVLTVDYEYKESRVVGFGTSGLRGTHQLGDFVRVGGTYVEDKHPPNDRNYTLRGVDAEVRVGMNTKLTAEYAETENSQLQGYTSANGGLSFVGQGSVNFAAPEQMRNGAYVVRVQSRAVKKLDISAYVQKYNPFFSNADTVFSQGDEKKYGVEAQYRFTNNFSVRYRQDALHLIKSNLFAATRDRAKFYTTQAVYDGQKVLAIAEYRKSDVDIPEQSRVINSLFSINDFDDAAGVKLGYRIDDQYMPYVRGQVTFDDAGKSNNQMGVGLEARVLDKSTVAVEENFGNIGDSTQLRFETKTSDTSTAYANIARGRDTLRGDGVRTTLGSSHLLGNRSRFFSEKDYSEYQGQSHARNILGYERSFFDNRLGALLTFERNELDRPKEAGVGSVELANAVSAGLTYRQDEFLEATSRFEFVRLNESSFGNGRNFLSYNNLGIHFTQDLEFFSRLNFSKVRDINRSNTLADFAEMTAGFSFRPVEWDRFNALTRYTFLSDNLPDDRFDSAVALEDLSHILAFEAGYDLNRYFEIVEKVAYKVQELASSFTGAIRVYNYLWINRLNFHVTRKWDFGLEYRLLTQQGAGENFRAGVLVELDRELFDYTRIGVGYNFTDFDDDLRRNNSYQSYGQGPFVRLTGKF